MEIRYNEMKYWRHFKGGESSIIQFMHERGGS